MTESPASEEMLAATAAEGRSSSAVELLTAPSMSVSLLAAAVLVTVVVVDEVVVDLLAIEEVMVGMSSWRGRPCEIPLAWMRIGVSAVPATEQPFRLKFDPMIVKDGRTAEVDGGCGGTVPAAGRVMSSVLLAPLMPMGG